MQLQTGIMFQEGKKAKFQPPLLIQIIIFISLFLAGQILASIPTVIPMIVAITRQLEQSDSSQLDMNPETISALMGDNTLIYMLFGTAFGLILILLYCRFIEKRSLRSIGFQKKGLAAHYLFGYLAGVLLFTAALGLGVITGTIRFDGVNKNMPMGMIVLFFVGYLIQGMNEEVLLRGYFMVSLSNKIPLPAAIMINSIFFALLHLFNPGVTILSIVNLTLFGVLASIITIKWDNLWGVGALHSAWNFVQGNIFGLKVSGMSSNATVFRFTQTESGSFMNGGTFGMEGGLAVTAVYVIAIICILCYKRRPVAEAVSI